MSATGEGEAAPVAAEQQPSAPAAEEQPKQVEEPEKKEKEKKPRAPREKKPRKPRTASHPPYFQMIKEALQALNEKSGSSPYAIAKYMEDKHKSVLPSNFRKILTLQLKNCTAKGKLIKIKASYKLMEAGTEKDQKTEPAKKPAAKRSKAKSTEAAAAPKRPRTTRKSDAAAAVKKAAKPARKARKAAATAKPKQPKSIKSPAAKRAKKAAAA